MIAFQTLSTADSTTFREFEKSHDFSKTLPQNFFSLPLGNAYLSLPFYGDFDNFVAKKVGKCAILDFHVFVEREKRKR